MVPFPKCPTCGRSVVGLVRYGSGIRKAQHFHPEPPIRCRVTLLQYAALCDEFAEYNRRGAIDARREERWCRPTLVIRYKAADPVAFRQMLAAARRRGGAD